MSIKTNDEIFGHLTQYQNGDWEFNYFVDALNKELEISIEASDDSNGKPNESTYNFFLWFRENQNSFRDLLESAIFKSYTDRIEGFRDGWGSSANKQAPFLSESKEIWNLLSNPKITFLSDFADASVFFETSWDKEHGITVLIKNEKVICIE